MSLARITIPRLISSPDIDNTSKQNLARANEQLIKRILAFHDIDADAEGSITHTFQRLKDSLKDRNSGNVGRINSTWIRNT